MKLVVLGAPGAGKGTQAHFISIHYGIPHISTGNLLREEMKNKTALGKEISHLIEAGKLVPDETVTEVLKERLNEADCNNGFLLDGYPRTLAQAQITENIAGELDKVVSVHVDDAVIIDRMSGRRICEDCGATFHLHYKPPKIKRQCDDCGGHLIQRDDDKAKTVRDRLNIYHKEAEPIKSFFQKLGKLVVVDGMNDIEKITDTIIAAIEANSIGG